MRDITKHKICQYSLDLENEVKGSCYMPDWKIQLRKIGTSNIVDLYCVVTGTWKWGQGKMAFERIICSYT